MRSWGMCAVLLVCQRFDHHIRWRHFGWYAKLIDKHRFRRRRGLIFCFVLLSVRFGDEDNPDPTFHPCKGLFNTCCSLKTDIPNIPIIVKKEGCGYRNHEGVGFRITGEKDNEAQYGEFPWMVWHGITDRFRWCSTRHSIDIWHSMF